MSLCARGGGGERGCGGGGDGGWRDLLKAEL